MKRSTLRNYKATERTAEEKGRQNFYRVADCRKRDLSGAVSLLTLGNYIDALKTLESLGKNGDVLYCKAVILWLKGLTEEADEILTLLLKKNHDKAGKLKRLLQVPVRALVQRIPAIEFSDGGEVEVLRIGYDDKADVLVEPYETSASILSKIPRGWKADFFFYFKPEYGLPVDFSNFPFPSVAFTADYDTHLFQRFEQIEGFDLLICASESDHFELSRIFKRPVWTHLTAQGIWVPEGNFPPVDQRPIDVFISGYVLHPFFKYKVETVNRVMELADRFNIKILDYTRTDVMSPLNDFLTKSSYYEYLKRSKLVLAPPARRHGIVPTRGLEALATGCGVLYPSGSSLELLFPEGNGFFFYEEDGLTDLIINILENPSKISEAVLGGAERVRRLFAYPEAFVRMLKLIKLQLEGLLPTKNLRLTKAGVRRQKKSRVIILTTFNENSGAGPKDEIALHGLNRKRCLTLMNSGTPYRGDYKCANELAWACVGEFFARKLLGEPSPPESLVHEAIASLESSLSSVIGGKVPIVNLFNLSRLYFIVGDYPSAEKRFLKVLALSDREISFDPLREDLYAPIRFFPYFFDYASYVDVLIEYAMARKNNDGEGALVHLGKLIGIVKDSAKLHLGIMAFEKGDYEKAVELCAECENPFGTVCLIKALIKTKNISKARELLAKEPLGLPYTLFLTEELPHLNKDVKKALQRCARVVSSYQIKGQSLGRSEDVLVVKEQSRDAFVIEDHLILLKPVVLKGSNAVVLKCPADIPLHAKRATMEKLCRGAIHAPPGESVFIYDEGDEALLRVEVRPFDFR